MGKTILHIDCVDQRLFVAYDPLIASGGVNEDVIKFNFCPLWDGFGKTAVFYRKPSEVFHVTVSGDECLIPAEVLTEKGEFYFGVFGSKGDATRTTEVIKYSVAQGAMIPGAAPAAPTPDIYAQIMSAVASLEDRVIPINKGGTNATNALDALINLGLTDSVVYDVDAPDAAAWEHYTKLHIVEKAQDRRITVFNAGWKGKSYGTAIAWRTSNLIFVIAHNSQATGGVKFWVYAINNQKWSDVPLNVECGGTGASDAVNALKNLGAAKEVHTHTMGDVSCTRLSDTGETEYLFPPMVEGVAYRTFERWNDLPVYTMLFDAGTMEDNTYVGYPVSGTRSIIRGVANISGAQVPFGKSGDSHYLQCDFAKAEMWKRCGTAQVGKPVKAQIWYVKANLT